MVKPSTSSSSSTAAASGERNQQPEDPKYKGVRKRKWGKWVSEIRLPNSRERIWLGSYDSPEKAARAFDAALFCLRGRDATFNFPNCPPDIPGARTLTRSEIQTVAARFANDTPPGLGSTSSWTSEVVQGDSDVSAIDWSFLNLLDSNEGVSDFGLYSGIQYDNMGMGGEMYPTVPPVPVEDHNMINGDENHEGEAYSSHHSFLWNF